MKRIVPILCALLCLTACTQNPAPDETTTPADPLHKTVYVHSSITQEFGASVSKTEFLFDEKDHVKEVVVYTNGTESKRHSVECDENGNYVRWVSEGSVMEYDYDELGQSLGMSMYINDALVSSTQYTWENGLRTSVTTTMATQNLTQKTLMTYNRAGHLLRQDSYLGDTLHSYSIYATDEQGRTQSISAYQPDGTLLYQQSSVWNGTTQTTTTTQDGSVVQTSIMTYDENGNLLTHTVYNADNELVSKETHTWKALQVDLDSPRASV